jgi:glycosyltransferase involved in cell wall biosynthesis
MDGHLADSGQPEKRGSTPDVSVVMGVFDEQERLAGSIESILQQVDVSLELIVVDDGSSDRSGQILDEYARQDPRLRVIHQNNQGLTRALINGCMEARGPYIGRQDVGDLSAPDRLARQKALLDALPEVTFVSCWTEFVGPGLEPLYVGRGSGMVAYPAQILCDDAEDGVLDGPTQHGSVLFRKDAYCRAGGYRPQFYYGQDWDLWYRLAALGWFSMVELPLCRAMIDPAGISARNKKMQASLARLSREALRLRRLGLSEQDVLSEAATIRPRHSEGRRSSAAGLYFVGECLRRNGDRRAEDYFWKSIKSYPTSARSWVRLVQCKLTAR